ncbi:MAG: CoA transferase, partial [Myxococcales bacterium]|nr:CoA transferase [Myxococcales bacterium]
EHRDELDAYIGRFTSEHEPHELARTLQEAGIEAGAVQNFDDLLNDPQLAHRGHFQTLRHSKLGEMSFENYGIRLGDGPPEMRIPGPNLGEHNDYVLGELLGYSSEEIESMTEKQIIV